MHTIFSWLIGVWGIVSLFLNMSVVTNFLGWGIWGGILAFFVFPITITIAPWYALIALGNPIPLVVTYGSPIVIILYFLFRSKSHSP